MSNLIELIDALNRMDDNPGWLSGDKRLIAHLCRCVVEMQSEINKLKRQVNGPKGTPCHDWELKEQ